MDFFEDTYASQDSETFFNPFTEYIFDCDWLEFAIPELGLPPLAVSHSELLEEFPARFGSLDQSASDHNLPISNGSSSAVSQCQEIDILTLK